MPEIVRAALVQITLDGRQTVHGRGQRRLRPASRRRGRQVACFQELFSGPYFCQVQDPTYFDLAERGPRRPHRRTDARPGPRARTWCSSCPCSKRNRRASTTTAPSWSTPTAPTWASTARPTSPRCRAFSRSTTSARATSGTPCSRPRSAPIGVYICYDRHFPEGWRALGLAGARIVFNPSATSRSLSQYLWRLEQPAAAVANEYFVGAINRVGVEPLGDDDFYGGSYFVDPRGQLVGEAAPDDSQRRRRAGPRHGPPGRGTPDLGLLPRPQPGRLRPLVQP